MVGSGNVIFLVASVLPVVVDQEHLLLTTDPTDLAASADNGRRAEPAHDGVPTEWWRFGWWVRPGPEYAPAPEPPAAGPADSSGRTKEEPAAEPVAAASGGRLGVPATVLSAYRRAATRVRVLDPACRLSWEMLSGIGKVESGHAWGGYVTSRGDTVRPILGPRLDGSRYAAISDSDGGRLDGDGQWDRAVGPMQFIPGSWQHFAADGNGDSVRSPHNVFDAALASGLYLCVGRGDLGSSGDLLEALHRYNHSTSYVQTVYAWILAYRQGGATATAADFSHIRALGGGGGGGDPSSPERRTPEPTASPRPTDGPDPGEPGPEDPEPVPGEPVPGEPWPESPGPSPSPDPAPSPGHTPAPWCPVESLPVCVELPGLAVDLDGAVQPDK